MPVIGHTVTWDVRPEATEKMIADGRHWRCACECGMTLKGTRWGIAPNIVSHLEKQERLQFRGTR
jgi:hypothetical protein